MEFSTFVNLRIQDNTPGEFTAKRKGSYSVGGQSEFQAKNNE